MGNWLDHLFQDYWTNKRFEDVNDRVMRGRRVDMKVRQELKDRIEELEADLGRMALLLRVVLDSCIKKGVLTRDELSKMVGEIDMLDGVQDGRLDPKKTRPSGP